MTKDAEYYAALEERLTKDSKPTTEYQGDPAMDAMAATLDSPPFRPPTQQEITSLLPVPKCACNQAQYAVFVWHNPELKSADWYLTMATPVRPIPVVKHCPFCGSELPALIRKNLPDGYPLECYYSVESK